MNRTQKNKCRQIAERYGIQNQEKQTVSELSELLYVLTRRPSQRGQNWREQLIDEISDVKIMLQQLMTMYDIEAETISEQIDFKLNRQLGRMESENI